jgi:D-amino-acid dehydrogenase
VSSPDVVVVGGGVVGLACAWELRRTGAEVRVLERGRAGDGVSRGNTGWVVPSMASPLPAPGMVREGIKQLVTRGGAFVLRPSPDPAFVRWLWQFRRSCAPARFDEGVRALLALNRRTFELFDRYHGDGIRFEMHATGLLIVARTEEGLDHYRALFRRMRELGYDGGEPDELGPDAVAELEPAVDRRAVAAGLHARVDRYVRPEGLTAALASRLREEAVDVEEGCELIRIDPRGGRWVLETTTGTKEADKVVVAAGLETDRLLRERAPRLRMQAARGYSVTVVGRGTPPRHALYLAEARLGLSPFEQGVRIAGVFELGAKDATAPKDAGAKLLAAARPYLSGWRPEPDGDAFTAWAGLRPMTADGLPVIGELPGSPGLYVAAGHGMLGITLAPATAALLAPLVVDGSAAPELAPFDPARRG